MNRLTVFGAWAPLTECSCPRQPLSNLTMLMVGVIELQACFETDPILRVVAGHLCLCMYGRFRCSDSGRLINIQIEQSKDARGRPNSRVCSDAFETKTQSGFKHARRHLPTVALTASVTGMDGLES